MTYVPDIALMSHEQLVSWLNRADHVLETEGVAMDRVWVVDQVSLDEILEQIQALPDSEDECYYECPWLRPGEEA